MADTRPKKQIPLRLSAKLYDQIAAAAREPGDGAGFMTRLQPGRRMISAP